MPEADSTPTPPSPTPPTPAAAPGPSRILERMLDRLFASIASGPNLNCRPHSSRQRIDLTQLSRLRDQEPTAAMRALLSEECGTRLVGRATAPPPSPGGNGWRRNSSQDASAAAGGIEEPEEVRRAREAYASQQALISKLRIIAEEAKTYEDDTGVSVLNIGFPLLAMPPGTGLRAGALSRRVLAPVAYIPVLLKVGGGASPSVEIACREDEMDRVGPNEALLAWLEQQTGRKTGDLFQDDTGSQPWREVQSIVEAVCRLLGLEPRADFGAGGAAEGWEERLVLRDAPKADEFASMPTIVPVAVLGLFPASNQGLLRDTQGMMAEGVPPGPIEAFLRADAMLDEPAAETPFEHDGAAGARRARSFGDERLVAAADPCQSRAVTLARTTRGLVVHGPPGTGKSQTITNIIGDHLARGERVLFVCDKRTALDVVANRLEHLGLGRLCALVHDAARDQRELYMGIRRQLDDLPEARGREADERRLTKIDAELGRLHDELTEAWRALMVPEAEEDANRRWSEHAGGEGSLHDLIGRWLERQGVADALGPDTGDTAAQVTLDGVAAARVELEEILRRGEDVEYASNPWREAAGATLEALLSAPMDAWRRRMEEVERIACEGDETLGANGAIPPFDPAVDVIAQGNARATLADRLEEARSSSSLGQRRRWLAANAAEVARAAARLKEVEEPLARLLDKPLDPELLAIVRDRPPTAADIAAQLGEIEAYLAAASTWHAFLHVVARMRAGRVVREYGLGLSRESAERVRRFLLGLRSLLACAGVAAWLREPASSPPAPPALADQESTALALVAHRRIVSLLTEIAGVATARSAREPVRTALAEESASSPIAAEAIAGLRASPARAEAILALGESLRSSELFAGDWVRDRHAAACAGDVAGPVLGELRARFDTLEGVVRVKQGLASLPAALADLAGRAVVAGVEPGDALRAMERAACANEISQRLAAAPALRQLDARRTQAMFDRVRALEAEKKETVRSVILLRWLARQQERLLAGTGSRLNSLGAEVRRRLVTRGRHALRLRQVIAMGASIDGGDPIFDLRPVWMASPETVAQVFPRRPLFDVVIFDEASQCRLEEALPVLTRGKRVVIAGDPKQLPPTRFFETTVAASESDDEPETDQDLFEQQQSEVEDLLTAALGLQVEQCYLDVHYRSHNADLIAFSNDQFYGSRLQPIPGHPSHKSRFPPLTLYRADGVYEDRTNEAEAAHVVKIVHDLLRRAEAPSIGIACFNISQRDLIADRLEEAAAEDPDFAVRYAAARSRQGDGSFEGLFVKNLENVQGDERDHIIISTTYGPNKDGRFYRRFGPLGRVGGGRRLNVLVTRARDEVHLVTSIPAGEYRSLPPLPAGQIAGGGWLLFRYLKFAEDLAALYENMHAIEERLVESPEPEARVLIGASATPSTFAAALGRTLARTRNVGSQVHWGNDGFCVDDALQHPARQDDVTIGVLCDMTRYRYAEDAVEWDIFRTGILEGQGWKLHRLWTPHFFRDPAGCVGRIMQDVAALLQEAEARERETADGRVARETEEES